MESRASVKRRLVDEEVLQHLCQQHLQRPVRAPDGNEERWQEINPFEFSRALGEALAERFQQTRERRAAWQAALPIALGSWSRGELCPKSDVDLLFVGSEAAAAELTAWAQEAGIKIRSRVPEAIDDWTKGVEAFDILALLRARALTPSAESQLRQQLELLKARLPTLRRSFLATCRLERRERTERHDSIANLLEPNLKYGPGGLRDLDQALSLRRLFPEKFPSDDHATHVYEYYRRFYGLTRIRTHLAEGGGDLLSAYEQKPIGEWFGYSSSREFMRQIQSGLSRISFYADVDFERARLSQRRLHELDRQQPADLTEACEWLERDPSLLMQAKARRSGALLKRSGREPFRKLMLKTIDPFADEQWSIAFFRSRLIDHAVTDFRKLVGYVQHDQYHRFTVDAHLLQAVREMKRIGQKPTLLGRLGPVAKSLSKEDWRILGWAALYHDVGKGSGRDHSERSGEIARLDLPAYGVSAEALDEVLWLVEHHLELSIAAFRGNPAAPAMWRQLQSKGIDGKRLRRLAIFTAVDIRATNREAYTPWKERLLAELVQNLEKPEARNMAAIAQSPLLRKLHRKGLDQAVLHSLERLDPFLLAAIPPAVLAKDLIQIAGSGRRTEAELDVSVIRVGRSGRVWIRFHTGRDERGLFARFSRALQKAGLAVRHASVLSDPLLGVYDWFEIKPPYSIKGLSDRLLRLLRAPEVAGPAAGEVLAVAFDSVESLSGDESEWAISFRGRDQAGALRAAAEALHAEGAEITWANVHTWGRQIDDVFGVKPSASGVDDLLTRLRLRLRVPIDASEEPGAKLAQS